MEKVLYPSSQLFPPPICPVDRDMDCRDIDCVLQTKDVLSYGDYGDKLYPYSGLLCRMILCLYI